MLEGSGRGQGAHLVLEQLQLLLHRPVALGQGARGRAVLRPHGDERVGDDAVRRRRAARHAQHQRGLVDHHQHGQPARLRHDPAAGRQAAVGREAGRDRSGLAARREAAQTRASPTCSTTIAKEFKDPETGKTPTNETRVHRDRGQDLRARRCGCRRSRSRATRSRAGPISARKACTAAPKYSFKKGWGGKFATATKKFEFYSETVKKGLAEHATKHQTTVDDILTVSGYVARGELAFVPHYEPPKRHGSVSGVSVRLHRLQVAPQPRGPFGRICPGTRSSRRSIRVMSPGTTCSR